MVTRQAPNGNGRGQKKKTQAPSKPAGRACGQKKKEHNEPKQPVTTLKKQAATVKLAKHATAPINPRHKSCRGQRASRLLSATQAEGGRHPQVEGSPTPCHPTLPDSIPHRPTPPTPPQPASPHPIPPHATPPSPTPPHPTPPHSTSSGDTRQTATAHAHRTTTHNFQHLPQRFHL